MNEPDYNGFWNALPVVALQASREEMVEAFCQQYREEIVTALMQLSRIGVLGASQLHPNPPEKCDLCGIALGKHACFVDGQQMSQGEWANMCPICFYKKGHSIRRGKGQLYVHLGSGGWRSVNVCDSTPPA